MQKIISNITFFGGIATFVFDVIWLIYGVMDMNKVLAELSATPGTGGADYFGLGWGWGLGVFMISALGLVLSVISAILSQQRKRKWISFVAILLFVLLTAVGYFAFR